MPLFGIGDKVMLSDNERSLSSGCLGCIGDGLVGTVVSCLDDLSFVTVQCDDSRSPKQSTCEYNTRDLSLVEPSAASGTYEEPALNTPAAKAAAPVPQQPAAAKPAAKAAAPADDPPDLDDDDYDDEPPDLADDDDSDDSAGFCFVFIHSIYQYFERCNPGILNILLLSLCLLVLEKGVKGEKKGSQRERIL